MNLTKKRKTLIGIAALLFLLIITNPSITDFKSYRGNSARRTLNLFVLSVYKTGAGKYVGFFGNFIELPRSPYVEEKISSTASVDSAKRDTSKRNYVVSGKTSDGLPVFKKTN